MRLALALVAGMAGTAGAAPWSDWVGDYSGKLAWSHCTTRGARAATLPLDGVDGALQIDLAPAGRALRTFSLLEEEDGTLSGRDGDVTIAIRRPRANAVALVVTYDSGCTLRAALARPAAQCPRLAAWARVAARCTKRALVVPTRCADAEQLELALVDAGCAPHPDGGPPTSVACGTLASSAGALQRCRMPARVRDTLVIRARAIVAASRTADRASLPVVEQQCHALHVDVAAARTKFRCP